MQERIQCKAPQRVAMVKERDHFCLFVNQLKLNLSAGSISMTRIEIYEVVMNLTVNLTNRWGQRFLVPDLLQLQHPPHLYLLRTDRNGAYVTGHTADW
jgi:hypothetical protein